ncbi:MAG: SsrA-binding protein SmpB [Alphaproteobacteria bacterium]|nr:SsrA-binding protein SmpB [Alphaproteobacteria bacterium]
MSKKEVKQKFISTGVVAENRRARFNYAIGETFEAGLSLTGGEVKSLRLGRANIADGYVSPDAKGLVINNITIGKFEAESPFAARTEKRPRRLLMKQKEIEKIAGAFSAKGSTIIPLRLYFNDRGKAKLLIAIATGKQNFDKRATIKEREWKREKQRLMKVSRTS